MTSSLPGVKYGAAHYKYLEQDKRNALKISKGCFDAKMILSPDSITDVQWWYNKINCSKNNIAKGDPVIEISSDASSSGGELSATIFVLEGHLTLSKQNTILMLTNFWQQLLKFSLMHMLSCYQTTLLLYMPSTICALINLSCVIP